MQWSSDKINSGSKMFPKSVFIWIATVCAAGNVLTQSNTCSVSSGSSILTSALLKSLIAGADQSVRPTTDCGGPTLIRGYYNLLNLYRDRVNQGIYRINGLINLNWNDSRLAWDPAQFGGINKIQVPSDKIWTPDAVLSNILDYKDGVFGNTVYRAVVSSNGHVSWSRPATALSVGVTTKDPHGLDVVSIQHGFVSWTYDATGIIFEADFTDITVANFYDVNGVEEYNLINGTLSVIKEIFPVSANPFSVVAVDLNLRSKAIVSRS